MNDGYCHMMFQLIYKLNEWRFDVFKLLLYDVELIYRLNEWRFDELFLVI